jgi:hypothetical protein
MAWHRLHRQGGRTAVDDRDDDTGKDTRAL